MSEFINRRGINSNKKILEVDDVTRDDSGEIINLLVKEIRNDLKKEVVKLLNNLKDREQKVITLRFGLDVEEKQTLEEIGKIYGVTKECIRQTEIRALPYLHWWTFIGYYMAVGECTLSTIVSIRDKIARGKKLDDFEKEFKRDNPQYFRWKSEQAESDMLLKEIWNKD